MEKGRVLLSASMLCLIFGTALSGNDKRGEFAQVACFIFAAIYGIFGIMCLTGFIA